MDFINLTFTCTCVSETAVCTGAEWLCDGGHIRGVGLLRLSNNQGLLGVLSGEQLSKQFFSPIYCFA